MNLKASFLPSTASVAFALLLGFGISACSEETVNPPVTPTTFPVTSATCEIPPDDSQAEPSSKVVASIYVDATESMQGFVQQGSTTRYARLLDGIVGGLDQGWKQDEIVVYPFGEKVGGKITRENFGQVKTVDFYRTKKDFNFTHIEEAIKHSQAAQDNLTIIVTDLYQKQGEIDKVLPVLKQKYLNSKNPRFSVGIFAHRSEFDGMIYDVGFERQGQGQGQSFFYTTNKKPSDKDKYRPFYLIVLGTQSNVEAFFDSLKKTEKAKQARLDNAEWIIFSPEIVRSIAVLNQSNSSIITPESKNDESTRRPLERVSGINSSAGTIRVAQEYKESVELLKITKLTSKKSSIKNEVNYTPLPYTLISDFAPQTEVNVFNDQQKKFVPSDDTRLKKALKLESITPDDKNQQLTFSTVIDSSAINPGIYQFTVSLKAKLGEAPWWKSWNGTEEIVSKKEGFKTYNLLHFLTSIQRGMSQSSDPTIGKFCYVIKKEN